MSRGNGNGNVDLALQGAASGEARYPSLEAALEDALFPVQRLFMAWLNERQSQVAAVVAEYHSCHGCLPTADQLAAAIPPLPAAAASWFLRRLAAPGRLAAPERLNTYHGGNGHG